MLALSVGAAMIVGGIASLVRNRLLLYPPPDAWHVSAPPTVSR